MTTSHKTPALAEAGFKALALILLIVGTGAPAAAQTGSCTVLEQNLYVRDVMSDIYLWRSELPALDPAQFDSPDAYLEAVRFRPLDDSFSYITSRAASDALYSNSEYVGLGFSSTWRGDEFVLSQVFPGSPASEAGLARGDRIVEIDGRTVADLIATGEIGGAFGPSEAGVAVHVVAVRGSARIDAHMVKRPVIIPTVSHTTVIDVAGRRVGYIFFRNFVEPSRDALDEAFEELRLQGATELVLDLRYNGGGLVGVAQHLGGLIGGTLTSGQVFAEYAHNDRNQFRNRVLRFPTPESALRLDRLFVVTTRASASASELVINALRPFIPVIAIGDRTYGKPVGQYLIPFCDKVLAPVSFSLRNADGQGDFFDGLQPTCRAADDLDHAVGDPAESSLREALVFIGTGACSAPPALDRRAPREPARARTAGWQSVLGAH